MILKKKKYRINELIKRRRAWCTAAVVVMNQSSLHLWPWSFNSSLQRLLLE